MPYPPSRPQSIVSLSKRWIVYPIVGLVVWALKNIIWDIIYPPLHPITARLLDSTLQDITSTNILSLVQQNSNLIDFLIAVIVMGLLAQWQVNRAQDKTKEAKDKLAEEKANSERNIKAVYKSTRASLEKVEQSLARVEQKNTELKKQAEENAETYKNNRRIWQEQKQKAEEEALHWKEKYYALDFELRESYYSMPKPSQEFQELHGPPVTFQDGPFTMQGSYEDIDKIEEARKKIHSERRVQDEIDSNLNELEKFIKPLYTTFDKYKDWTPVNWEINIMIFESMFNGAKEVLKYKGLPLAFSIMFKFGPSGEYLKSLGADKVNSMIDIMQLNGNLAQLQLKDLIKQYLEIRQKSGNPDEKFWSDPDFINVYNITSRMDILVRERYNELMWKK